MFKRRGREKQAAAAEEEKEEEGKERELLRDATINCMQSVLIKVERVRARTHDLSKTPSSISLRYNRELGARSRNKLYRRKKESTATMTTTAKESNERAKRHTKPIHTVHPCSHPICVCILIFPRDTGLFMESCVQFLCLHCSTTRKAIAHMHAHTRTTYAQCAEIKHSQKTMTKLITINFCRTKTKALKTATIKKISSKKEKKGTYC